MLLGLILFKLIIVLEVDEEFWDSLFSWLFFKLRLTGITIGVELITGVRIGVSVGFGVVGVMLVFFVLVLVVGIVGG